MHILETFRGRTAYFVNCINFTAEMQYYSHYQNIILILPEKPSKRHLLLIIGFDNPIMA